MKAIVMGVIQGLTEFLPVSSSAHLVLTPYLFRWYDPGLAYDVALHMGTLAAVLLYFWRDWARLVEDFGRSLLEPRKIFKLRKTSNIQWQLLVLGCIPAGIAGLLFEKQAEHLFRHPILIALTLSVFGILLWVADKKGRKNQDVSALSARDALLIGCAQALAIIPGVSRSGITITAALLLGFKRPVALRYSFLLSAPITAGAGLIKSKYIVSALRAGGPLAEMITAGFLASLASGLLAVTLLHYMATKQNFRVFAYYRAAVAVTIVAVYSLRWMR